LGHRLARVDGEVQKRLPQHRGVAVHRRHVRRRVDLDAQLLACASGPITGRISSNTAVTRTGCAQILGRVNFRKPGRPRRAAGLRSR